MNKFHNDDEPHAKFAPEFNMLDFIMDFESGEIDSEEDLIFGFQQLINSGDAWRLQGFYGRTAQALIDAGHCHAKGGK